MSTEKKKISKIRNGNRSTFKNYQNQNDEDKENFSGKIKWKFEKNYE